MWGWGFGPGSPSAFEADIMSALEHVRKHIRTYSTLFLGGYSFELVVKQTLL